MTVPDDEAPPVTDAGDTDTPITGGDVDAAGLTVNGRLAALAPYDAEIVTGVEAVTVLFVTNANDADVDPVKTVRFGGSDENSSG